MTAKQSKVIALVLVVSAIVVAWMMVSMRPEKSRKPRPAKPVNVEVQQLFAKTFTVQVSSFGTVQARTRSTLTPQVGGEIVWVSEHFRDGGFVQKGETILQLDDRDYQAAVTIAEASLRENQARVEEEKARAQQALKDWQRLNPGEEPGPLVLRKPQVAAAEAALASARARLDLARLDLERAQVKAPYDARILSIHANLGQVVGASSKLADIYAIDYLEVRLPLSQFQLKYLDLPERYVDAVEKPASPVKLYADIGGKQFIWPAVLDRTESAVDPDSRQWYVIARVDNPYGSQFADRPPLKFGQFLRAEIQGQTLDNVFVIPREALYQGNEVALMEDGQLVRRQTDPLWTDEQNAVLSYPLEDGDMLVTTPVSTMLSGTRISSGDEASERKKAKPGSKKPASAKES